MPACVQAVQQLSHPRCARPVLGTNVLRLPRLLARFDQFRFARFIELRDHIEYRIEASAPGHNHACTNQAAFVKRAQCVQVSIKGLILRVPLQIESNPAFDVVNFVPIDKVLDQTRCAL